MDLIKEAKRRYPHGTVFRGASNDIVYTVNIGTPKTYHTSESDKWVDGGFNKNYLYYKGKWAEIISSPNVEPIYSIY